MRPGNLAAKPMTPIPGIAAPATPAATAASAAPPARPATSGSRPPDTAGRGGPGSDPAPPRGVATVRLRATSATPSATTGPARRPPAARRALLPLLLAIGPGVLAMAGDNDAGGLLTYASTGARFGPAFFVPLLLPLVALSFVIQEMALRLGVATGKSFAALLRERVDRRWAMLAAADLALTNWFSLVTEFAGMGLGLAHFGVPLVIGIPAALAATVAVAVCLPYRSTERLALAIAVLSVLFLPLALARHAPLGSVALLPARTGPAFAFFALAAAGNAVAPWMVFFQTKAVQDRGMTPADLPGGRWDLALGSGLQVAVAVAVMLLAAAAPAPGRFQAAAWLSHLGEGSPLLGDLFSLGLIDAGFVAAITVGLSSAWAVAETCSARASCNLTPREAPGFYGLYAAGLVSAAAAVLLPHLPLDLVAVGAQAAAALLMPPIVGLLLVLANDRRLPARHRNGPLANVAGAAAAVLFTVASLALLWSVPGA